MKLSFLIPVYNSVSTLPRLVTSLLKQEGDIEFLFGVEPSKDSSLNYLIDKQKEDNRIKVIVNETKLGPLGNRINLIRHASGDLIAFSDSDDYLASDFAKVAISGFDDGIDVVCLDYLVEYKGKIKKNLFRPRRKQVLTGEKACKKLLKDASLRGFLWNKVFRKELFHSDNLLLLKEGMMFEDTPLVYSLFSSSRLVKILPYPLYIYVKGEGSLTSSENKDRAHNHIDSFAVIKYASTKLGYPYNQDFASSYSRIKLSIFFDLYLSKKDGLSKDEIKMEKKRLRMVKGKDFPNEDHFSSSILKMESIF